MFPKTLSTLSTYYFGNRKRKHTQLILLENVCHGSSRPLTKNELLLSFSPATLHTRHCFRRWRVLMGPSALGMPPPSLRLSFPSCKSWLWKLPPSQLLSVTLWCHFLKVLNNFSTRGPEFSFCTRSYNSCRQRCPVGSIEKQSSCAQLWSSARKACGHCSSASQPE